ncbi:MAG: hypothetical protein J5I92_12285 [Thiogranum sp.]|nr:hypothetical protein [Thiogranum sp.]
MMNARTVLILLSIMPAAAPLASALEDVDGQSTTPVIPAAHLGPDSEPVTGPFVQAAADTEPVVERTGNNPSAAARSGEPQAGSPEVFAHDSAAPGGAPTPAAIWILGSGLIGVAAIARRRSTTPAVAPAAAMGPAG